MGRYAQMTRLLSIWLRLNWNKLTMRTILAFLYQSNEAKFMIFFHFECNLPFQHRFSLTWILSEIFRKTIFYWTCLIVALDIISIFWSYADDWTFTMFLRFKRFGKQNYVNIELQIQSSALGQTSQVRAQISKIKTKQNKTKNMCNVNDWFHFHRSSNC